VATRGTGMGRARFRCKMPPERTDQAVREQVQHLKSVCNTRSVVLARSVVGQARSFQSTHPVRGGDAHGHDDVGGHNGWVFGKNVRLARCAPPPPRNRRLQHSRPGARMGRCPCGVCLAPSVRQPLHLTLVRYLSVQPDEKHEREAWEIPYMIAAVGTTAILVIGLTYKPKTSIKVC